MDKDIILAAIDQVFGSIPRPRTMVRNPNHCAECADHEVVMQAVTPKNITLKEIGKIGWDPVCYLTDNAYCYFVPGFARLVVNTGIDDDYSYLDQFVFHLMVGSRIETFTSEQRCAMIELIDYLREAIVEELVVKTVVPSYVDALDQIRDRLSAEAC